MFPVGIGVEISARFSHSHSRKDLLLLISVSNPPSIPAGAQDSWKRAAALFAAGGIKPMGFQTLMDILICAFPIILFLKPLVSLSLSSLYPASPDIPITYGLDSSRSLVSCRDHEKSQTHWTVEIPVLDLAASSLFLKNPGHKHYI